MVQRSGGSGICSARAHLLPWIRREEPKETELASGVESSPNKPVLPIALGAAEDCQSFGGRHRHEHRRARGARRQIHAKQPQRRRAVVLGTLFLAAVGRDLLLKSLNEEARRALEATTKGYAYQRDFAKKCVAQGRAEGEACAILAVLRARGIPVPESARQRILARMIAMTVHAWPK